jgi:hypothetical protein
MACVPYKVSVAKAFQIPFILSKKSDLGRVANVLNAPNYFLPFDLQLSTFQPATKTAVVAYYGFSIPLVNWPDDCVSKIANHRATIPRHTRVLPAGEGRGEGE